MKKVYLCAFVVAVALLLFFNSPAQVKPTVTPDFSKLLNQDLLASGGRTSQYANEASSVTVPNGITQSEGTVDPNLAEYCYQQGMLLLQENKKKDAVEYLKYYAKVGSNPRQVARAAQLAAENSD